ncbi:MIP/aquaporin family protein [Subtercola lobariae]|uniref:Major intrinsic protein n=1 Tax=Subtercola lobariae TaxID=1588641 RepID=A0A917B6X9_9MICO|nr:aquaporin [Subtercola lobariae]GGF23139.1 major intrinsic protein [Subtercola lobariae]
MTNPTDQDGDSAAEPLRQVHLGLSISDQRLIRNFNDTSLENRRLFAEFFGTFLLVIAAAGADIVNTLTHGSVGRVALVTAPALTVIAVILFMGAVSGAHLNPVVSIAFALRRDFSWRRVPAYIFAQLIGAAAASLLLLTIFGSAGGSGRTEPGPGFTDLQAFAIEILLTCGLVSTILGAASGAQNVGSLSAFAVGSYILLAGLWAEPVSGASMNPARTFGPDLVSLNVSTLWIYVTGPLIGSVIAVGIAHILRGPGGGRSGRKAAQGTLGTDTDH